MHTSLFIHWQGVLDYYEPPYITIHSITQYYYLIRCDTTCLKQVLLKCDVIFLLNNATLQHTYEHASTISLCAGHITNIFLFSRQQEDTLVIQTESKWHQQDGLSFIFQLMITPLTHPSPGNRGD